MAPYGKLNFNNLKNCQTAFPSGCIILHWRQQCMEVPVSSPLLRRGHFLLFAGFFFFFIFKSFIEVQLIYNVVVIFAVQQSDSIVHIPHPFFFRFVPRLDDHRTLGRVPCAGQRVPLASHSVDLSVPVSVPTPTPVHPSPTLKKE